MKRKYFISMAAILALFITCRNPAVDIPPNIPQGTSYTVTFDKNHQDASGWTEANPRTKTVSPATTVDNMPLAPTRADYNFLKWTVDKNGIGSVFSATTTVNANITVYAQWQAKGGPMPTTYTIVLSTIGAVTGDSVTTSHLTSVEAGEPITISYTLADDKINNRLVFSGTKEDIEQVDEAGTGTRVYTVDEDDAIEGTITITATFTHSDKELDTIAFEGTGNITKTYGDAAFTRAVTVTGQGSGAITYSSDNPGVATVNSGTGTVTILKVGTTVITATKAADTTYEEATASYTLNVEKLQLTISVPNVTTTKQYDGNKTAAVSIGTLDNVVSGDTVNVLGSAEYNSANVVDAATITVTYSISGADTDNYIKPDNFIINGTITKAPGVTPSEVLTVATITHSSITVNPVSAPPTGQAVEYAIDTTTNPSSVWQPGTLFIGLQPETNYYVFARAKENANYQAGTIRTSAAIITDPTPPIPPVIVDFESDSLGNTTKYTYTGGGSNPTLSIVADPANSGQKSLRIVAGGYNQAAVIPITLPYSLGSWGTLTFRLYVSAGTVSNQTVNVYAGNQTSQFLQHGFGNPSDSQYPQFANLLLGQAQTSTTQNSWQNITIPIINPGSPINGYKNTVYLAIGMNQSDSITYHLDDITFAISSGFVPPYVPPAPTPPSTGAVRSGNYRNLFEEMGKTSAEVDARVQAIYNQLFVTGTTDQKIFIESVNDTAYIWTFDTDDVRSEGMSYGMMMCVQMDDRTRFDKLWKWARTHMYHADASNGAERKGFFAWKRNTNGGGGDNNNAPDGEFYFTTALLFASARWGDGTGIFNYGKEARQILHDMINRSGNESATPPMFRKSNHSSGVGMYMPVFQAYGNSYNFTDPSYHLPAFYDVWAIEIENGTQYHNEIWGSTAAAEADAEFYRRAAATSRAFFHTTVNSTTGLGPSYSNFDGSPTGSGAFAEFDYDAWRIALNIGFDYSWWAADPWQITQSDRIQSFFHSKGVESYGSLWTLDGQVRNNNSDHSPGLVGCNAVASLAASQAITWDFVEDFWNTSTTEGKYRYYDGCLYMMSLLHVSGNFKAYLSNGGTPPPPSSNISPTTATFDKNTAGANYKDIIVNMTLNDNTLLSIKNENTALTLSTHYTISGSTVTLKKEYLADLSNGTTTLTFTFSAGSARTIAITIGDTTGGGPIGETVTEYNFTTNPTVTVDYDKSNTDTFTAEVTNGVLKVTKVTNNHASPKLILPFDLGGTALGSYSKIRFVMRGVSGDLSNTSFIAQVSTNGTSYTQIGSVSTGSFGSTFANYDISIGSSTASGPITIKFYVDNKPAYVYEIQSIELIP